jgi:thiamine kinase-like enzyme
VTVREVTSVRPWAQAGPEIAFGDDVTPQDRDDIAALLARWDATPFGAGPVRIDCLVGGANNRNYCVWGSGAKLALRLASPQSDRLAVDRASATQAQCDAAAADVAPAVLACELPQGHMLAEFLDGAVLREASFTDPDVVAEVARTLRRLHATPTTCREFSAFDDIRHWIGLARQDGTQLDPDVPELLATVDRIERTVVAAALPRVFCHNDTVPQNFIRSPSGVRLVDWDFAGRSWAAFELAAFANTAELDDERVEVLFDAYAGGASDAQRAMVALLSVVGAMREVAWAYMATPMLKGTTTLMDGWTYEGFLAANLDRARALVGAPRFGDLFRRAAAERGRAW